MYVARGQFGAAKARYQSVDVVSKVESADPHALVAILYDETLKAMDAMAVANNRKDFGQRGERQAKVLRLLSGLEAGLDFDQGGEIAIGLAKIYREARRLVIAAGRENDSDQIMKAREIIADIADAWGQIRANG